MTTNDAPAEPGYLVNATLVEIGVNMGDHAQDVRKAVDVRPDDTIDSVIERLFNRKWSAQRYRDDVVLELRIAVDRDTVTEGGGPF